MPRLTRGWVRVGHEYAPESVNCAAAFMAPQIHFLMMWSGGTSQEHQGGGDGTQWGPSGSGTEAAGHHES